VTSQIDLKALRDNLEISIEMQAVARQMQDTMAEPAGPERQQRLDANMAELRRLQTSMHADVRAAGSSLPPMSPPTR
jgi:succinate dehydrogenase/fumarate reductase flavoprotein subunit